MTLDTFESPLATRYASPEMGALFSSRNRALLFRRLWIALARAEQTLGLPITTAQLHAMETALPHIDFDAIAAYEKKLRHDVMAHIHAYGDQCPVAKPILHLGATSTYVTDNADLIILRSSLQLLYTKLLHLINRLTHLADQLADAPCLAYTHYQPAQPTTIGKRIALWLQDLLLDAQTLEALIASLPFLGAKGATGTQASFLALFNGDARKVEALERHIADSFNFTTILPICGQTYTRKLDLNILNALSSFAATAHKLATDLRLLAHDGEIAESFSEHQVGSSAMPYKRNPIYSERICALSRYLMTLPANAAMTAATQWLERSLDDSANRRIVLPDACLTADALLNLLLHLFTTLHFSLDASLHRLNAQLHHLAMEPILMAAAQKGGNRQELHERLRLLSTHTSTDALLKAIAADPAFNLSYPELEQLLSNLVGLAPHQTRAYLSREVRPYLAAHPLPPLKPTAVHV